MTAVVENGVDRDVHDVDDLVAVEPLGHLVLSSSCSYVNCLALHAPPRILGMHAGSMSHRVSLEGCLRNNQNETAAARKKSETKKPVSCNVDHQLVEIDVQMRCNQSMKHTGVYDLPARATDFLEQNLPWQHSLPSLACPGLLQAGHAYVQARASCICTGNFSSS